MCRRPSTPWAELASASSQLYGCSSVEDDVVRFRTTEGVECSRLVEEIEGPIVPASCGAEPEPQRTFRVQLRGWEAD